MKKTKGITLVTLVVTIVVILLLSGITISTMTGENGILTKAAEAKQKTEIAALREKVGLITLNWETDRILDPTVTIEDFWERLIEEGIIIDENDIGEPETDGDNKVYTIDTGDGYVMEMVVNSSGNITIGDIAKGTDLPLKIKSIDVTEKTTNSISVEVKVRENAGKGTVKLSYYYKTGEGEYEPLEEDTTDLTATFDGLRKGVEYSIKVVAEKDGQTAELVINVKTEELKEGKVTASQVTWDETTHTASVTLTTESNYQIQYQKNGTDGEWTTVAKGEKSTKITDLNHNDIIYTRLWDGYNGGYEDSVTIEDKESPIVTITEGTVTTNSIQVSVSSVDNQGGMPDSPTYKYYIKKKADTNYPTTVYKSSTETTCTFEELDQGTEYDIKVTTQDKAGNTGTGTLTATKTGIVTAADTNLATAVLKASAPTWDEATHTASITISTTTNYQIQYQKGGIDGEWITVEKGQNSVTISDLNHNQTVYARLWDGKNAGKEASVTIKDGQEPTVTITQGTVTTRSIQVSVSSEDNEGGMPENPTYKYYIKKKADSNYPETAYKSSTETTCTFEGLDQETEYDIKVTTQDKAGNTGEKELTAVKTGKVDVPSTDLKTGSLIASAPTWDTATHTASITLSTTTDYQIQYQKGGINGEWTTVKKGQNSVVISDLNHNDTVFVRLYDGKNAGKEASAIVKDGQTPIVTVSQGTVTTRSIEVSVSSSDAQGGMPATPMYNYYYKKKEDSNYPNTAYKSSTETTCTFDELDQGTEYDIKVTTTDKAGNTGEKELTGIETGRIEAVSGDLNDETLTASELTWDETSHTASITLSTTTDYQIQYQIGGTDGEWITVEENRTTISDLNHGDTIFVRLYDGKNAGIEASTTIKDEQAPTVTVTEETVTTNSIQVSVESSDGQGGMPDSVTYKYYYKKKDDADYPSTAYKSSTETICTFEELDQGIEYDIKVTTQDKAGNTGEKELTATKTGTVTSADTNLATAALKASAPTWDADTHKASITLTTTTSYQIQYQKGGINGTWTTVAKGTTSTTVSDLSHNDTVYARLWDGNNGGKEASVTVLDGQAPTVTVNQGTVTTNSIQVSVESSDDQGGMPTSPTYNYYYKKKSETNYPSTASKSGTVTSYTFTGLAQETEYDVKVTTQDKAGNTGTGELTAIKTGTVDAAKTDLAEVPLTASAPTWDESTHKASIILSTTTSYQIQYQKGGIAGTWTTGTTVSDLSHNETVFARLWDGNNGGKEASITIKDDNPPSATVNLTSTTITEGEKIGVTVAHVDNESGVKIASCKWKFTTSSSKIGTDASKYTGDMSGTFNSEGQTIECVVNTEGTYWLHVLTVDNADKTTETVSSNSVKVEPKGIIELDPVGIYYADIDDDGKPDGVIYADLVVGSVRVPQSVANAKKYTISQESYSGIFGTGPVLSASGTGEQRFYIMALTNVDDYSHTWYKNASTDITDDSMTMRYRIWLGKN